MAYTFLHLNRFAEAEETCRQADAKGMELGGFHEIRYFLAAMRGDTSAMDQQIKWAMGNSSVAMLFSWKWQGDAAGFSGRLKKAKDIYRQGSEAAVQIGSKDPRAGEAVASFLAGPATSGLHGTRRWNPG